MKNYEGYNTARIIGIINEDLIFDHKEGKETLYKTTIKIKRRVGYEIVPALIPDSKIDVHKNHNGKIVAIYGTAESYNEGDERKFGSCYIKANKIEETTNCRQEKLAHNNQVYLNGYICKKCKMQKIASGEIITKFKIATNMGDKKIYLHCIAWGENAPYVDKLKLSAKVEILGKFGYEYTEFPKTVISVGKIGERLDLYRGKIEE